MLHTTRSDFSRIALVIVMILTGTLLGIGHASAQDPATTPITNPLSITNTDDGCVLTLANASLMVETELCTDVHIVQFNNYQFLVFDPGCAMDIFDDAGMPDLNKNPSTLHWIDTTGDRYHAATNETAHLREVCFAFAISLDPLSTTSTSTTMTITEMENDILADGKTDIEIVLGNLHIICIGCPEDSVFQLDSSTILVVGDCIGGQAIPAGNMGTDMGWHAYAIYLDGHLEKDPMLATSFCWIIGTTFGRVI